MKCKAITIRGKRCTQTAVIDNYCMNHFIQQTKEGDKNESKKISSNMD